MGAKVKSQRVIPTHNGKRPRFELMTGRMWFGIYPSPNGTGIYTVVSANGMVHGTVNYVRGQGWMAASVEAGLVGPEQTAVDAAWRMLNAWRTVNV